MHLGNYGWCPQCRRPLDPSGACHYRFCSPHSISRHKCLFPKLPFSINTNNLPITIDSLIAALEQGIKYRNYLHCLQRQTVHAIKNRLRFENVIQHPDEAIKLKDIFSIFYLLMGTHAGIFKICIFIIEERTLKLLCEQKYVHILFSPAPTPYDTEEYCINLLYRDGGIISYLQ